MAHTMTPLTRVRYAGSPYQTSMAEAGQRRLLEAAPRWHRSSAAWPRPMNLPGAGTGLLYTTQGCSTLPRGGLAALRGRRKLASTYCRLRGEGVSSPLLLTADG